MEISQIRNLDNHFAGCVRYEKKTSSPLFLQVPLLLRLTILNNNRACLDRVADELCENESISGAAFGSVSTFFLLRCSRSFPRGSVMYGVFAYIRLNFMGTGTVGKYTMHGSSWILRVCVEVICFCVVFFL